MDVDVAPSINLKLSGFTSGSMQEMDYYDYYQEMDYYIEGENIYFIFVKSTLVIYALVFIQEHNMVSALSHTCEKHSQCISLYKCTLFMTDPLDVRVG